MSNAKDGASRTLTQVWWLWLGDTTEGAVRRLGKSEDATVTRVNESRLIEQGSVRVSEPAYQSERKNLHSDSKEFWSIKQNEVERAKTLTVVLRWNEWKARKVKGQRRLYSRTRQASGLFNLPHVPHHHQETHRDLQCTFGRCKIGSLSVSITASVMYED